MKNTFFRKCLNSEDLYHRNIFLHSFGQEFDFVIVRTIKLSHLNYLRFTTNFLIDNKFIIKYKNELIIDEADCLHVAFFTEDGIHGFLVYPSGYNYARYVSYYEKSFEL